MYLTKGAFAGQLWFRIKIMLVLVAIVNSFVVRALEKRVNARLRQRGVSAVYGGK